MYWIYAIFFFVNGENKRYRQLTKLYFESKGSQARHNKINAKMTKITCNMVVHIHLKYTFISSNTPNYII
jgi:hypothetical protein